MPAETAELDNHDLGTLEDFEDPSVRQEIASLRDGQTLQIALCVGGRHPSVAQLAQYINTVEKSLHEKIRALCHFQVPYHHIVKAIQLAGRPMAQIVLDMRKAAISDGDITYALRTAKISPAEIQAAFNFWDKTRQTAG